MWSPDLKQLAKNVEKRFDTAIGIGEGPIGKGGNEAERDDKKPMVEKDSLGEKSLVGTKPDEQITSTNLPASNLDSNETFQDTKEDISSLKEKTFQEMQIEELEKQILSSERERQRMGLTIADLERQLAELSSNSEPFAPLQSRLEMEQQNVERLQKDLKVAMEGKDEELQLRLEELTKDIQEKNQQNVQLESEREGLDRHISQLQEQMEELKSKNDLLAQKDAKRLDQLRRGLAKLESQGKEREEMKKDRERLLSQLQQERDLRIQMEDEKKDLERKITLQMNADSHIQALQSAFEGMQSETEIREQQFLRRIESLEGEKDQLTNTLTQWKSEKEAAVTLAKESKIKAETSESLIRDLKKKESDMQTSLSDERSRGEQLVQEIRALQGEISSLKGQRNVEEGNLGFNLSSSGAPSDFRLEMQNKFERWKDMFDAVDSRITLGVCLVISLFFVWFIFRSK